MNYPDLIGRLSKGRILVVGDAMLDVYVYGVGKLNPEAPVLDFHRQSSHECLGGAANVALQLANLGAEPVLVGLADARLKADIQANDISDEGIIDALQTTRKTRFVSEGQQVLRVSEDVEATQRDVWRAEALVKKLLPTCEAVVVSDYAKGLMGLKVIQAARHCAGNRPVVVDPPKRSNWGLYRGVTVLTPNEAELRAQMGGTSIGEQAKRLVRHTQASVAVTMGRLGIWLFCKDGTDQEVPTRPVSVRDVTGAGDAVAAVFGAGLAGGLSLQQCAAVANLAGRAIVQQQGCGDVTRENLLDEAGVQSKMRTASGAEQLCWIRRTRGQRVVFTNGCFDIFHAGHVALLNAAKREGDYLVVGLNSDESVRRLKGAGRPVVPEAQRAAVLSAIRSVDCVVVFGEDTPEELLKKLKPHVLVKGKDYGDGEVVGEELVKTVVRVPILEGVSSSGILERGRS